MEITCEKCKARLSVPDEKIPRGHRATFSCPKCKHKISLNITSPNHNTRVPEAESGVDEESSMPDGDFDQIEEDASLDFFEEGVKLALVLENNGKETEALKRTVEELNYRCVLGRNTREAISKMRLHHFELIFLPDRFDDIELSQSPVLQHINNLSMSVRRRIFLALIGAEFKTMDHMTAFAMSANMVINRNDLGRLTAILKHAISDNEKFYKVFMDTMVEVGRA
jgi:predicted Zn finger-like uncharacterized protein